MFQEDYEKLTRGEQRQFEDAVNDLLYTCFIVRKSFDRATNVSKISPTYLFIERHYNLINDFVGFIGLDLVKDDQNGVIYLNSEEGRNRIRIDSVTTLLVYALRSYYEEKVSDNPSLTETYMDSTTLKMILRDKGLMKVNKRLSTNALASGLKTLASYNIIARAQHSFYDSSYSFYILPSIRYVISNSKMNALYDEVTKIAEDNESVASEFGI
ncbi:MAG TPA: DUF4194 domain-containing protein [Firmicutes bacterium]|nr:putative uncharacterized protein [Clostridium sp. CAG:288]HAR48478.1 DUF4194 domain-containing protein [Bacillota bacterium]HAX01045.1 DUF4194 domain-containing protein [Bacillota bacterium]